MGKQIQMKYSVAALLATTNALHIRAQAPAAATCSSNFERLTEQKAYTLTSSFVTSNIKDGQFEDPSFPADDTSLYNEMQASSRNNRGQVRNYMSVAAYPGNGKDQLIFPRTSVFGVQKVSTQRFPSKVSMVTAGSSHQLPLLQPIQKESRPCSQDKILTPKTELSKLDSSSEENQSMLLLTIECQFTITVLLLDTTKTIHG